MNKLTMIRIHLLLKKNRIYRKSCDKEKKTGFYCAWAYRSQRKTRRSVLQHRIYFIAVPPPRQCIIYLPKGRSHPLFIRNVYVLFWLSSREMSASLYWFIESISSHRFLAVIIEKWIVVSWQIGYAVQYRNFIVMCYLRLKFIAALSSNHVVVFGQK